ncbi:candidate membrane protein [Ramlibacter tataouinensis TTB310]|uniref:Candidate membrane protein n=1 Tax=Ramlibacter tataouinensis (strain ATCC BAA-407 / DSM 14655 / LMG 21543 / TTB310) TaxID=365046 RepID=F5Y5Q2_RAMTT|nr:candidate membrane protein [Ramlibacter tataouinensis TTB310]
MFPPAAVGEFSVLTQIAFYWMTLALAQGPLKLLADVHQPPLEALRRLLAASLGRWLLLLPLAWVAVRMSEPGALLHALGWTTLIAVLQLGWYLAQPLTLRIGHPLSIASVRIAPPLVTLLVALALGWFWPGAHVSALLLSVTAGYVLGTLWLLPLRSARIPRIQGASSAVITQGDNRSTALRLAHTAADALIGTSILIVWHRMHGAAEAGYLAVLLRILGFVPAVTHAAWAQVLLAQNTPHRRASLRAGMGGAAVTTMLGLACAIALHLDMLSSAWSGLLPYLLPVVAWQAGACILASLSHLPFQQGRASAFSVAAICYDLLQLLLLILPFVLGLSLSPQLHIAAFGGLSLAGLLMLSLWVGRAH